MKQPDRRRFFAGAAAATGALLASARGGLAGPPGLSAEEKARLKAELQRELERKVYSVDEELFRKINRAADPRRLTGHERGHVPGIQAPRKVRRLQAFPVRIEVGAEKIHEMQVFHYVDWIALAVDGVQVNHATVTPLLNRPIVTFELVLERSATLVATEHCNLHGTWESEPFRVRVVD